MAFVNSDGPMGTLHAMQQAAHPPDRDYHDAHRADHAELDEIANDHAAHLDDHAARLDGHDALLAAHMADGHGGGGHHDDDSDDGGDG